MRKKLKENPTARLVAILCLIAIAAVICFIIKQITSEPELPDYYKFLAKQCGPSSCCVSSVNKMAENNYKNTTTTCPAGFNLNSLKCEDSLKWCEPINK